MDWTSIERQQKKKEMTALLFMTVLFIIGIAEEIAVNLKYSYILVHDLPGVSLVVIQVQATVFALTISLIALMSSRITDSYFGIYLNDFLLNKKPWIFTQKRIIGTALVFLIANFFFHIGGCYNLVINFFIISCGIVWLSVVQVYEAFTGKERIDEEIESYLRDRIKVGSNKEQADILNSFCCEWKKVITRQENGEYEEYTTIFFLMFQKAFGEDELRVVLQDRCVEFADILLERQETAEKGIRYLSDCYKQAWTYINKHKEKTKQFELPFHVFHHCCEKFVKPLTYCPRRKQSIFCRGELFRRALFLRIFGWHTILKIHTK